VRAQARKRFGTSRQALFNAFGPARHVLMGLRRRLQSAA
jgi:hypothetical protein